MNKPNFKEWAKQQNIEETYTDYPSFCVRKDAINTNGCGELVGKDISLEDLEVICLTWRKMGQLDILESIQDYIDREIKGWDRGSEERELLYKVQEIIKEFEP